MSFFATASASFLGLAAGLSLEWWKSSRAHTESLCVEICNFIASAADVGSEYWLTEPKEENTKILESRLVGFQHRISGYSEIINKRLYNEDVLIIENSLTDFFDSLTGGDFSSETRLKDEKKSKEIQDYASISIVSIRSSLLNKVSFHNTIKHHKTNIFIVAALSLFLITFLFFTSLCAYSIMFG